jgi:hypothetical protein
MNGFLKFALPVSIAFAAVTPQVALAQPEAAEVSAFAGKTLYGPKGERVAAIYKVTGGNPQLIVDGKIVTVPASSLSIADGKLSTSLTKKELTKR